jgi:ABC-type transport system involved in cytochrome bd biosynthesis fused ATPase/permease subunit
LTNDQKTRIAVARAIYSRPDIFLFENIFGQGYLFNEIICGLLADKTRLLITNNLEHVRRSNLVIFVNGNLAVGKILNFHIFRTKCNFWRIQSTIVR